MATAVVTGAGRGIGREVAMRLARRGYDVLATDVDEATAQATADAIGERAWAMTQDVRDPDSHRAVVDAAQARGPVEVWVNNAGVLRTEKVWEHSDGDVRLITDVNLLGVMWGSRAAVDAMRAGGGHVINLASMSAFGPVPGLAVYGAPSTRCSRSPSRCRATWRTRGSRSGCTPSVRTASTRAW